MKSVLLKRRTCQKRPFSQTRALQRRITWRSLSCSIRQRKDSSFNWQKKQYWLARVPVLKGKCTPAVIASLAVALQRPIGIVNTRLRQSCVFFHIGAKPLCLCCALELSRRRRLLLLLLLLVHRGACVFTVNPCKHEHCV